MQGHGGPDGQWIKCDQRGHCRWTGRTSVVAARLRLYEASRGILPGGTSLESTCGIARCVNLDHLRLSHPARSRPTIGTNAKLCRRGHELIAANVVRHRDGRIAYCRVCRNERRRERYRIDQSYARKEIERQRCRRRGS